MYQTKPRIAIYKTVFGKWQWYCMCGKFCGLSDTPLGAYKEWAFAAAKNTKY